MQTIDTKQCFVSILRQVKLNKKGNYCPLGSRCHFAHGRSDIRSMQEPLPPQAQVMPVDPMTALL